MKIKVLEKLPELEPPEDETTTKFTFRDADKLSPPLLQLDEVSFAYESTGRKVLTGVNIDIGLDSRLGLIGRPIQPLESLLPQMLTILG